MSPPNTTPTRAILASEPQPAGHIPGSNWTLSSILVPTALPPGSLLIEMLASGICHTDLLITSIPAHPSYPLHYPRVAGHEGAGYIRAIGLNVRNKDLVVGDPVLLSYYSCMDCVTCKLGRPNHCPSFGYNVIGQPDAFKSADGQTDVAGSFFGQSSFANLSVVKESSVVSAKTLIEKPEELKLFAPLGCGLQTGAGSVLKIAKAGKGDSVMVSGLGGVGLAAVMAAKIAGCHEIIGVDINASRVGRCEEFGATTALNTQNLPDLAGSLKQAANDGRGPDIFIDSNILLSPMPKASGPTGVSAVQQAAYKSLANGGTLVLVGASPDPVQRLDIDVRDMMTRCVKVVGCIMGDSNPEVFIPELVKYYREGRFPIDRMTTFYKAEDFKTALHDMHSGETIKAVLEW
ncbi:hypothetical protein LTR17_002026 [Elasticomyces elasticus]|nr:hypothetical protein LTR17_002026 [Elasticomyces elasticus]